MTEKDIQLAFEKLETMTPLEIAIAYRSDVGPDPLKDINFDSTTVPLHLQIGKWHDAQANPPPVGEDVLLHTCGQEREYVVGRLVLDGRYVMELGVNYGAYAPCVVQTTHEVVNVTHWMPLPKPPTE